MIDVHILTLPSDRQDWFMQCLESLRDEPVFVYQVSGRVDDIGNARADAFKLGSSEYVSFVDPDQRLPICGYHRCSFEGT